ncbi:hypothetical protein ACJIZ3_020383 [Penstemon smallii]|uniref:Uncharacterized protein n=1 Tax=Penstemon smallii TaxID=265156 RepID=A0ABD3SIJ9_9LAMI
MAGKQVPGDGLQPSLAGMSKNQLYDIMCQMKKLIEQNKEQAREILIQNPAMTRALFQAQIMLGMVQSPQSAPAISLTTSQNSQPSAVPNQQANVQAPSSFPGQAVQNQIKKQQLNQNMTSNPQPQSKPISPPNPQPQSKPISPPISQPQSTPTHIVHPIQQPKGHVSSHPTTMPTPQSPHVPNLTQLPQHTASQPPSHHQPPVPSLSMQSQQPMQNFGGQYMPLQPPLPPQPRPPMSAFPHQVHAQMGPNSGFQHPSGPQMHPSQHMFHSGTMPPAGLGPSYPQGQLPPSNQPLPPAIYQGGGHRMGMEFNQVGSSNQTDRGSNWMPGPPENTIGTQLPGPPSFAGQMGPGNQPPRPPPLTPELEKALLQQVMSLTPEQINILPTDQRNQILQLQQMLRQ